MKSFDERLEKDLFPDTPAAVDTLLKKTLADVCSRSEQPEKQQEPTVRFRKTETEQPRTKGSISRIRRIGLIAVAAVLVLCTVTVGTLVALKANTDLSPVAAATDVPSADVQTAQATDRPEATAKADAINTVYAATVDEFLQAIAPDTEIVLTGTVYDLKSASDYGAGVSTYYAWIEVEDGFELQLRDLKNFRLVGSGNTLIEAEPRHAQAIGAESCTGLVFSGLTVGHTVKPERCSGEVIYLSACEDVRIENCSLYGCGSWGVSAWYGDRIVITDSEIYECSDGALHLWECGDVRVLESTIRDCGSSESVANLVFIHDCNVTIANCDIYGNDTGSALISDYMNETAHSIALIGTDVHDNGRCTAVLEAEDDAVVIDGCAFRSNKGKILAWSIRAYDLDGNELDESDLAAMTLDRSRYDATPAEPTPAPAVTDPPVTVKEAATVDEFLQAIAPNTEIVLTGTVYDLSTASDFGADGGRYYTWNAADPAGIGDYADVLMLKNVERLEIKGAGTAVITGGDRTVIAAESCQKLTFSGIGFESAGISVLDLTNCSDIRAENCTIRGVGDAGAANGILVNAGEAVTAANCEMTGCGTAVAVMNSRGITVDECDMHDCATAIWISGSDDVFVTGCRLHDCWHAEPAPDDEQGDASYWINTDGACRNVRFENCEIYGNDCTALFAFYSAGDAVLSKLTVHDNAVDSMFECDENAETRFVPMILNSDVERNEIRYALIRGSAVTEVILSGTAVRENRIDHLFDLTCGVSVTVSGCEFRGNTVDTVFFRAEYGDPDVTGRVLDSEEHEIGEDDLAAMTLVREP